MYLLVFIHIGSRRIWVSKATHPNAQWVAQQARNMCLVAQEEQVKPTCVLRDRDTKFTRIGVRALLPRVPAPPGAGEPAADRKHTTAGN